MLLEKGGIVALLNMLIEQGLPATDVLRMATLNAAIRLQRNDLGLIAAGRIADLVVFDSLTQLNAQQVYVAGKLVAQQGKMLAPLSANPNVTAPRDTLQLQPLVAGDFVLKVPAICHGKPLCATLRAHVLPSGTRPRSKCVMAKCRSRQASA